MDNSRTEAIAQAREGVLAFQRALGIAESEARRLVLQRAEVELTMLARIVQFGGVLSERLLTLIEEDGPIEPRAWQPDQLLAEFRTYHTQGLWEGLLGDEELRALFKANELGLGELGRYSRVAGDVTHGMERTLTSEARSE